ncbi:WD40 repeat-like protein [Rhizopogon vinicolor AM-OR11-026]|uniref:WD40 repeat-like protein n=1 Tax=Rhizopogon vinicolor AM-OR11-026 TaxID=1314800 RepID=A0A1B7N2I8_9AGAM|nr:WD40 repeat-like protein [Rhizopogon vinicolor AM-OR11-026]
MTEDNPPRKKWWPKPKQSPSDLNSSRQEETRTISGNQLDSVHASPTGSRKGRGLVGRFFGKITKGPSPSVGQSLLPELRDPISDNSSQDPAPNDPAAPVNPNQATGPATVEDAVWTRNLKDHHQVELHDPMNERFADAAKRLARMGHVPRFVQSSTTSATDAVQSNFDTFSPSILELLQAFNSVAKWIADIHPYAKAAMDILTLASKMILDQADRDDAVSDLLTKVSEVYIFMTEKDSLAAIQSMQALYEEIAEQTLKCVEFIVEYSERKSVWMRLAKDVFKETRAIIQSHNDVLDGLMQNFRDQAAREILKDVHHMAEILNLNGMEYATNAGLDTSESKLCLPGTREEILSEIKSWIGNTGEDVPRVFWLSGTAGKGKSSIARTIAHSYNELGGLGAYFCFDRTQEADRRHEKIFSTIARDLADRNPAVRHELARVINDHKELMRTKDIRKQWQELILGPVGVASKAIPAPVLVTIDALDESGEADSRDEILRLLAGKLKTSPSQLPVNIRILVTSRPLEDICEMLRVDSSLRGFSLDDNVTPESAERDIERYISDKLANLRHVFDDGHFQTLSQKADGLFEWARLACEYIKNTNKVGMGPMRRFEAVVAKAAVDGTPLKGTLLLDEMYRRILAEIMPNEDRDEAIPIFRSVMGQILASLEPLPEAALTAMRQQFPCMDDRYEVDDVIRSMGSLLTGTVDSHTTIRPLHASFYDFLTNRTRSDNFFVDVSLVGRGLAFASLRIMEHGLRFNICSLDSSYMPNSSVPDLQERVKKSISAELSYSCRYWGTHVRATPFNPALAEEIVAFFDGERLLFWLEALALMKCIGGSIASLSSVADWLMVVVCSQGHAEYTRIGDAVKDTQRFVRTFAAAISHSTPHLYLSALPFAPTQSVISQKFATKFPRTPQVVADHVVNWPRTEKTLHANSRVLSVTVSPDGKRIVSGLLDDTIQVWDIESGEALGVPLRGHTRYVVSVAISPDGKHIVSGSADTTIRVWNMETGEALGAPLQGHTDSVSSVAISPDGKRIVSGSQDGMIRMWDIETGEALNTLQGYDSSVNSLAISPDGKRMVSGSSPNNVIEVWDMETGEALGVPLRGHTSRINSVAISRDGKCIVSGSRDGTIRVWDMETGKALGRPLGRHTSSVSSVAISPDGKHIVASLSFNSTIWVWDAGTGKVVLGSPLRGHTDSVRSIAISPDGKHFVSGSEDHTIRVWDMETEILDTPLRKRRGSIDCLAISPDRKYIVSGSDASIHVWDMETGKALGTPLEGHDCPIDSMAISPGGKFIVACLSNGLFWRWDIETASGKALGIRRPWRQDSIFLANFVLISPDGKHIVAPASPDDPTLLVWDMETCKVVSRVPVGETPSAISPDGKCIVSGSFHGTLQEWDMESGKALGAPLKGHSSEITFIQISSDGKHIVSSSSDGTIRVWDMESGKPLGAPLRGHTYMVLSIAISPDGKLIVSGSSDHTIRVWDMETGKALGDPLRGHTDSVTFVAMPDEKHVVSGSRDGTIRVWDLQLSINGHGPAICFSSNPTHALYSASLLQDSSTPFPFTVIPVPKVGWLMSPEGQLLLWIPAHFYPVIYAPGNKVVLSNDGALQLDLSRFAHGTSWGKCWSGSR